MESRRDEAEIIARIRGAMEGGAAATPSLAHDVDGMFAQEQPRLYAACRRIVGDRELARELAQEAMLVGWRKLAEYDGRVPFRTWLYGIARHLCFNAVRKQGDLLTEDGLLEAADEAGVLSRLQREERIALVAAAAAAVLDPQEQEAVHLRYVEQLPQERITVLLAIDEASGARGVLQRCRRKLRREMLRRLEALGHGSSFVRGTS